MELHPGEIVREAASRMAEAVLDTRDPFLNALANLLMELGDDMCDEAAIEAEFPDNIESARYQVVYTAYGPQRKFSDVWTEALAVAREYLTGMGADLAKLSAEIESRVLAEWT